VAPSLTFHDHIVELRRRLLWVGLSLAATAGLGYALRVRLINILQQPLGSPLFYSSPAGSFNFVMKLSMGIGIFVALPVIIYQILRYVEPALPHRIQKRTMLKIIGSSCLLAIAGISFAYFQMVPLSLKFFAGYSTAAIKPLISADQYLSYIMGNLVTFALMFQIPLLILFINWIKPTKPRQLLKYQRHVIVGAFGLSIILPFTYDPISQFVVAIPIVFLFYLSTIMLWAVNKRRKPSKVGVFEFVNIAPQTVKTIAQTAPAVVIEKLKIANPKQGRSIDGFVMKPSTNRQQPYLVGASAFSKVTVALSPIVPQKSSTPRILSMDGMVGQYKLIAT